jgi:hypothetical protein
MQEIFYILPIWLLCIIFLGTLMSALELGFRVGLVRQKAWNDADAGGGGIVLTSLFAVLGLVLAFTYASSVSRLDARKQAVILEANALGTAFLRADVVPEPGRSDLRAALLDYALTRTVTPGVQSTGDALRDMVAKSLEQQARLWPIVKRVAEGPVPAPIAALLIAAVNDVLDGNTIRLAAIQDHLPYAVMWLLLLVASAAMAVAGYNAGIQGRMSRWRMTAFAIVLTAIALVVLDLDRPQDGTVVVSQASINAVIAEVGAALEAERKLQSQ